MNTVRTHSQKCGYKVTTVRSHLGISKLAYVIWYTKLSSSHQIIQLERSLKKHSMFKPFSILVQKCVTFSLSYTTIIFFLNLRSSWYMDSTKSLSSGTLVSSTNITDRHDITNILLKMVLNTINQPPPTRRTSLLTTIHVSKNEEQGIIRQ